MLAEDVFKLKKIPKKKPPFCGGGFYQIYTCDFFNYSAATEADFSSAGSTHPIFPSVRR